MRIVSLLPSATEIVFAIGLGEDLVGVTHECDFPPAARRKTALTRNLLTAGLTSAEIDAAVALSQRDRHTIYALDAEALAALEPDVVLTQDLCEVCAVPRADVDAAVCSMPRAARVLSLDPACLEDVFADILRVGDALGVRHRASAVVAGLRARLDRVRNRTESVAGRPRVFCAEWLDPVYRAGHWLPEMTALAGGEEGLGRPREPSTRIEWERVLEYAPEVIVAMPCGFDARGAVAEVATLTSRPGFTDLPAARAGRVYAVDASSYFARPGPRLVDGVEILARLLHPDAFPRPLPAGACYRLDVRPDGSFAASEHR